MIWPKTAKREQRSAVLRTCTANQPFALSVAQRSRRACPKPQPFALSVAQRSRRACPKPQPFALSVAQRSRRACGEPLQARSIQNTDSVGNRDALAQRITLLDTIKQR